VLVDSRQSRELPFFPTLLCLWATGWVTSAVGALLVIHSAAPTGRSPVLLAVNLVLSSAIGAVVARQLLLELVGCELSYSAILLALVAGSVVSNVARLAVFAGLRHSGSPAFPVAGIGVLLMPAMLGALVSYWLLQNALRAQPAPLANPLPHAAAMPVSFANPYAERVAAARESTLGLVAAVDEAEPASVPSLIADGMMSLEAARKRLDEMPPPDHVPPDVPQRLTAGMAQLADELAATANEASITVTGGSRYRWELDRSAGLQAVRQALDELHALGY